MLSPRAAFWSLWKTSQVFHVFVQTDRARELLHWHEFEVCGEAASGNEAVEKVKYLKPEIVLLDINMPKKNGIQTAYEIRRITPSTKIVFLTVHKSPDITKATHAIGGAFVSKSSAGTELIPTLNRLTGRTEMKPQIVSD